jgi:diguanylate cyclase (GGDEF)-like protein
MKCIASSGAGGRVQRLQKETGPIPAFIAGAVFIALAGFGEFIVRLESDRDARAVENRALIAAAAIRGVIEADLNSTIYLGVGLSGYFSLGPEVTPSSAKAILSAVYKQGQHIRNIGLAPDNVLQYIYPIEGNEAALGLRYRENPNQWPAVEQAMETRDTVVDGPFKLVQGGYGIVTRTPVFLNDGAYWGLVSMVIDIESLLSDARDARLLNLDAAWSMRAPTSDPDLPAYVFGNNELFETDAVTLDVQLPGETWQLAVAGPPRSQAEMWRTQLLRILSLLFATIVALLVYLAVGERIQIQRMALSDPLTGLPNRRLLMERTEQRISLAQRYKTNFCLLHVDLNRFKPINDTHGHQAGDHVLQELANRFRTALRASDTVARTGGDEFVILLPDAESVGAADQVAKNLMQLVQSPIQYGGKTLEVSASVGIARYPDHGETVDTLIDHADKKMYASKRAGR